MSDEQVKKELPTKATNRDILAELNDWALYGSKEYPQEPIPKNLATRAMNEIERLRAIETRAKEAHSTVCYAAEMFCDCTICRRGLSKRKRTQAEAIDYILNGDTDAE